MMWRHYWAIGLRNAFWLRLAWWMPRELVYWCMVRAGAYATTGKYSDQVVPELLFMDALKRWEKK